MKESPQPLRGQRDPEVHGAVVTAAWRLIPFLCLLYLFAYLDRFNVGFASLTMNQDLGISMAAYGFAASLFFVGYILFEVPSNVILGKVGARVWIARIMITWGLISASMIFVVGEKSLGSLRFLLGVSEAGFFPGILIYLTEWFPRGDRAKMVGFFQMAMPLSGVLGAPISSLILKHMDTAGGIQGWKWLFLAEGLPSVFLGISCLWLLPSHPGEAGWLTATQKARLGTVLEAERMQTEQIRKFTFREGFTNPRVLVLALMFFCLVCGSTGIGFFLPQIVKDLGFGTAENGVVTAIPYLLSVIGMIWWSRRSDAKGERIGHVAIPAVFSAAGFLLAAFTLTKPLLAVTGLSMASIGIFSSFPVFWTLPTAFLTGTTAAAAVAFINSVGNVSGVVEPSIIGWTRDISGGFALMLVLLAVVLTIAALLAWIFAGMSRRAEVAASSEDSGATPVEVC
jgi:ACS family tartrate transporter-like MFS transporter